MLFRSQKKFGGITLPQIQDLSVFDPSLYDRDELRRCRKIDDKKIIMFLGTPISYKGVEDIIYALKKIDSAENVKLMLVGVNKKNPYVQGLLDIGKDKIIVVEGLCPIQKVPEFLSMADLIVIPQRNTPITQAQIPAKLIDAMAMAKPIIATNISDMSQILDGCGLIVEPGDIDDLADKISFLLANEKKAEELGLKAREKCKDKFSFETAEEILIGIFDKYK